MKKYFYPVLLIVSFVFAQKEYQVNDIIANVQKKYKSVNDLTADFFQSVQFKLTGITNEYKGKIYLKKEDYFRMSIGDQEIVTDGKTVWRFSKSRNQVLIDQVKKESGTLLPREIFFEYPKNYFSEILRTEISQGKKFYIMKLTPKSSEQLVQSMKVWIEEAGWIITQVETVDLNDNITQYRLGDYKLNTGLDKSLFVFVRPPGVEEVDLRSNPN